jgi:hypothetical protein
MARSMPSLRVTSLVFSTGRTQGAVEGKVRDSVDCGFCAQISSSCLCRTLCSLPAMFLWMGYTGIQFHVYESCLRWSSGSQPRASAASLTSLVSGGIAGFAATIATYPLDITRTICAQHEAGAVVVIAFWGVCAVRFAIAHLPPVQHLSIRHTLRSLVSQVSAALAPVHPAFFTRGFTESRISRITSCSSQQRPAPPPPHPLPLTPSPSPPSPLLPPPHAPSARFPSTLTPPSFLQVPLVALQFAANNLFLSFAPAPPSGQQPTHFTAFLCGGAAGVFVSRLI